MGSLSRSGQRPVGLVIAVGVAYFLATWLGVALRPQLGLCIFCPAAGVAVGALILFGPNARMPIATSVAITTVASSIIFGKSPWEAAAFGFINTGQALLTTWLIERWFGDDLKLKAVPQVLGFLVASAIGVAIGATGAAIAKTLAEQIAFHYAWQVCFGACLLGTLTIAPLLIGLGELPRELPPRRELTEGTIAVVVLALLSVLLILLPQEPWDSALPVAFVLPVLLWLAVRCRLVFCAAAASVLAVTIFWSTASHTGHFGDESIPLAGRILAAQTYATAGTLLALILSALFAERRSREALLEVGNEQLRTRNAQLALAGRAGRVGSYAYDVNKGVMQISEGYAAIYGLPAGTTETTLCEWRSRVHPDELRRVEVFRDQVFANRQNESNIEYRIVRSDGEMRWVERRSSVSYDGDGRPTRVVGVSIDVTERKRAEEGQRVLVAELDHRVKNAIATVSAVVSQTRQGRKSVADFAAALEGRLRSMAATHELLSARRWSGVSLANLVSHELEPYASGNNTEIDGPDVALRPEAGQAMAMVIHELATNAAKYGALATRKGRVSIQWDRRLNGRSRPDLVLEWQEIGGPPVNAPGNSGYGTSTIRDLIPYEFGGTVDLVFAPEGVQCRLELPADWLSDAAHPGSGAIPCAAAE